MYRKQMNFIESKIRHALYAWITFSLGMISGADCLRESDNRQYRGYSIPFRAFTALQNVDPLADTGDEQEWIGAALFCPGFGLSPFRGEV